ncbi:hypothetical protein D3C87_280190 [compost metagenome]
MSSFKLKTLYVVNTHTSSVVLKGGFIDVPLGGYAVIPEQDAQHPDVLYAATRKWVEITDVEPDASTLKKPELPIAEITGYKGMTAEELQASKADETPKSNATAEALGKPGVEAVTEATSERIGETAEVANSKRTRKASAKDAE